MKYKDKKRYYFAFGSNLDNDQMSSRCPHAILVGPAKVHGWRLEFGGFSMRWRGGTATIAQYPDSETWGAVYEIDNHCVRKLDRFETVKLHFYHHRLLDCHMKDGQVIQAYTYIKNKSKTKTRLPSYRYINQIEVCAEKCGVLRSYIKSLSKFYPESEINKHLILKRTI